MHAVEARRGKASVPGFLAYGSYRLLGALVGPLPPQIGYRLATRTGGLLYVLSPQLRRVLAHNIGHVLGTDANSEEVQTLVRLACVNIAKGHYDLFRVSRLTTEEIRDMTQIEGAEHLSQALARGRGVIVVSAHLGNVDIMGQLPLAYGVPVTAAAQHIQPERLFRYLLQLRQSHGLRLIPSDEPMLGLFRALKRGEIIALPLDRDVSDHSRLVKFFGSPTHLPDGPVRVALRTGAALIPVFVLRLPGDSFLVQIEPQLELPHTGDKEGDVVAGMEMAVAVMERHIAQHPEQWLVAAPVWPMD
jgi:lauroyl/myristoyl acyltransferase